MSIYNHTGIVVTDLDRSKRFYEEVLGFRFWYEITPDDEMTAKLSSLRPPLGVTASYYVLEGFVLEFLHYSEPGAIKPFQARTMDEPGLTHLSIGVDDIYATAQKAVEYGGQIIEDSDVGAALFIRDPDGQLLELLPTGYRDRLPPRP
jgi:catechol 2,3-dioxygenase-like lactoylglutathione lyase family enzyme